MRIKKIPESTERERDDDDVLVIFVFIFPLALLLTHTPYSLFFKVRRLHTYFSFFIRIYIYECIEIFMKQNEK